MTRRRRLIRRAQRSPSRPENIPGNIPAPLHGEPTPEPVEDSDLGHLRRLARVQGVYAAAKAFTAEELRRMARVNGVTYLNPRARKVDIVAALTA